MSEAETDAGPLEWRPLAFLLVASGAAFLLLGVAERDPTPLFLALPLLLAAPAAAFAGPRSAPSARVDARAEGHGADVLFRGSVALRSDGRAGDLILECDRPPGLTESRPPREGRAGALVTFERAWKVREPTIVVVPPVRVRWRDPMGLVERAVDVEASPTIVERYPPEVTRIGAVRLRRTMLLPGESRSPRLGTAGEFHGIRPAVASDPPRRINWRASARAGEYLANEYEPDRTGDVLLFLDARPSSLGPALDERLLGISRAAATGIASSFLREKARVGLAVFGEFLDVVPLGMGKAHAQRVRTALLGTRLAAVRAPSERGAIAAARYFRPGVTTLLLSPLADEPASDLVPLLRRRGYPVVVLSPSPIPIAAAQRTLSDEEEALVARLARLLRRERLAESWRYAPTIDWEEYWSLAGFVSFLRRPLSRRAN